MIVKQMLDDAGIKALVENLSLQGAVGELPAGEATSPRVRVDADDADKARKIVQAFEHHQRLARERVTYADPIDHEDWTAWPTCPDCGRRRQTVCPICETAGTTLPLADPNHEGVAPALGPTKDQPEEHLPLLICTTCDEPFRPRFYKICQWCRHEFDDGIPPPRTPPPMERLNPRVWAMAMGLLGLVAALCVYFWWIAQ